MERDVMQTILGLISIPMFIFASIVVTIFIWRHGSDLIRFWKKGEE